MPAAARVHGKTRPALIYGRAGRAVLRCYLFALSSRLEPPPSGAESGCVRGAVWKPHSRLSGLFSGAGRAAECALRGALSRFTPAVCLLTNRTACGMLRFYTAGSRSPFVRSRDVGAVICLCGFTSGWPFVCGDLDGATGDAGYGGWRRGACALLRGRIGSEMLSAGSTLGLNVEAALRPPQTASKSLRLSGLSSGAGRAAECALRGGVVLVWIRCAVTRVHRKTRPALIYGRAGRAVLRCYLLALSSRLEPPPSGAESGCNARSGVAAGTARLSP